MENAGDHFLFSLGLAPHERDVARRALAEVDCDIRGVPAVVYCSARYAHRRDAVERDAREALEAAGFGARITRVSEHARLLASAPSATVYSPQGTPSRLYIESEGMIASDGPLPPAGAVAELAPALVAHAARVRRAYLSR